MLFHNMDIAWYFKDKNLWYFEQEILHGTLKNRNFLDTDYFLWDCSLNELVWSNYFPLALFMLLFYWYEFVVAVCVCVLNVAVGLWRKTTIHVLLHASLFTSCCCIVIRTQNSIVSQCNLTQTWRQSCLVTSWQTIRW